MSHDPAHFSCNGPSRHEFPQLAPQRFIEQYCSLPRVYVLPTYLSYLLKVQLVKYAILLDALCKKLNVLSFIDFFQINNSNICTCKYIGDTQLQTQPVKKQDGCKGVFFLSSFSCNCYVNIFYQLLRHLSQFYL